ncbi:type II toxin-antitoxin system RelE/ParE family toxin [Streptomyces werraensis]|uniref:type II toxin-antitoxin system RelE/ParE family toxin n=1 Tax=Streptomyces werraensis TaxID=68284 RepID=UPI003F4DD7AE
MPCDSGRSPDASPSAPAARPARSRLKKLLPGRCWITVRGSVADAVRQSVLEGVRPGSSGSSEIRILFAFDPVRRAVLLVAGDKAGNWQRWYDVNIPIAEKRYRAHVTALETREYE